MGEEMICDVILPRNKVKGEVTERSFYQTLSMYVFLEIFLIIC